MKAGLFTAAVALFGTANAQVTVTNPANTTPGLAASYPTLAAAITDLNAQTNIAGPVVLTVTGSETAPAGGYAITAVPLGTSATNNIVINGGGFTITASPAHTVASYTDAIFKLVGADWVTLQNFTMVENAGNTNTAGATNTMTEWGVALLYAATNNGAQNCTIQNNTITLNRLWANSWGIYANSTHSSTNITTVATASTVLGGSTGLKVYGNTISNVNNGICVVGPTAAADYNNVVDIGGTGGAQANTLTNFGTTGTFASAPANVDAAVNGILVRNSININISYNTITSSAGGTTVGTLRAINLPAFSVAPTGTIVNSINNNVISLQSAVAAGAVNGILVNGTTGNATTTQNINNNNFTQLNHSVAASGAILAISDAMANLNNNINGNTFTNLTTNTTGSFTFIGNSITVPAGGSQSLSNNSIVTAFNKTGSGGAVTGMTTAGSSTTITSNWNNNTFSNITVTGITTVTVINQTDGGTVNHNITGNTISNITGGTGTISCLVSSFGGGNGGNGNLVSNNVISNINGQGTVTGMTIGASGTTQTVTGNTIFGLTSSSTTLAVTGMIVSGGTTLNVFGNKIYDLTQTAANTTSPSVVGMTVSGGTTVTAYNNLIGNLSASLANATNALVGLNISGGTTVRSYFNTVRLAGSSTGAVFGSSAVSASTTPNVTLTNNIFINTSSTTGAGLAVAYRRSSTTLTTYNAASNNNNFFGSTIYTDGTNTDVTMAAYKARVAARDASSFSENTTFTSTVGSNAGFLHVDTATPTQTESAGVTIAGITTDYDAQTRNASTPDIGADEFAGILLDLSGPAISYTPLTNTLCTNALSLTATITDPSVVNVTPGTKPRLYYKKSTDANTYVGNTSADNGWKYVEASNGASPFSFTMNGALLQTAIAAGDVIQYFVVAQDQNGTPNVGINSGTFAATPASVNLTSAAFPLTGTINQYSVLNSVATSVTIGAAGTYPTLTGVGGLFAAINGAGLSANTVATIIDASITETGATALNQIAYGCSGTATLTIKPQTTSTLTGTVASGALIKLNGADNVIIDGSNSGGTDRSLTITNSNVTAPCGVWIASTGLGLGATNNTVKNCNINVNAATTATAYGVSVSGATIGSAGADNDNTTIQNNAINASGVGVYANGSTTVSAGAIDNLNIAGNAFTANSALNVMGVRVGNALTASVNTNTFNLVTSTFDQPTGISIEAGVSNSSVTANQITQVVTTNTGGYGGRGITIGTGSAASNITVANNFVAGVNGSNWNSFANSSAFGIGIGVTGNGALTTVTGGVNLYYNSVNMTGSMGSGSTTAITTALYVGTGASNLDIRNNIFANTQTGTSATQKNYAVYSAVGNTAYANINHNDYWVSNSFNAGSAILGFIGSDQASFSGFTTAFGGNANSKNVAPVFVSTTDLHLDNANVSNGTNLAYGGTTVSVTTDIDGQTRGTPPTIGADQYTPPFCVAPSATVAYVYDCGNTQFFLNVTVTGLNGATGADIFSDYGGNPGGQVNVGTGTYQLGPFPSTTNVALTVIRNGDPTCTNALGSFTYNCADFGKNALWFDGVNDGVNCGATPSLNITGTQLTLEAWIYPTAFKTNVFEGNIINKEGGNAGYQLRCGGAGVLESALGNGTGYITVTSPASTLTLNTWQHVAVTYDGAFARLFRNGVQVAQVAGTAAITTSPNALRIGDYAVTPGARTFAGKIDEVRIWNIAIDGATINANQNVEYCGYEANLQAYYRFNQGVADGNNAGVTTLTDITANANTGTLYNFALNGTTSNWVQGKTGMVFCVACSGPPTAGTIVGSNIACSATTSTLTLSGATTGPGISYQWSYGAAGDGFANLLGTGNTQSTATIPLGTWEVRVTVTCFGNGSNATPAFSLQKNQTPTASASSTSPACIGQPLNLTGTHSNLPGTTFAWTGPNAFTSTQQSPQVSASATSAMAGTYSLTATTGGCSSAPATTVVVVNASPAISSVTATPNPACFNGNSQLLASGGQPGTVDQYSFSSAPGTFTSIVGAPGTVVINTGSDDTSYGPYALGFSFVFNGTTFTTAGVSANGFVGLGAAPSSSYTAISSGASNNIIAGFNNDLYGLTAGATMVYRLSGTPGSQVFTFEWANWGYWSGGLNEISFQIKLYEGSNNVQVVYTNGTATTANAVQVGLRGSSAAVYNNRTTTSNWSATTAGGSNAATCTIDAVVRPANGLTFTWTPPAPTWSWSPATFLTSTTIANPVAQNVTAASTTYTVTATTAAGCTSFGTVTLTTSGAFDAGTITGTTYFCAGGSTTLSLTGLNGVAPFTYAWSNGPTTATSAVNTVGPVTATITDACGNSYTTPAVNITQNSLPPVAVNPTTGNYCGGAPAIALAASGANTYSWSPAAGLSATTGANVNATPATTTTYTVSGTDGFGCVGTATSAITYQTPPTITITSNPPSFCGTGGGDAVLTAGSASISNYNLTWTSLSGAPLSPGVPGPYDASTSITATSNYSVQGVGATGSPIEGCVANANYSLGVYALPSASMSFTPTAPQCPGATITVNSGLSAGNFVSTSIPHAPSTPPPTPTVLATAGAAVVPLSTGSLDDGGWGGIPIPFTFNFFSTPYNAISVGTNGTLIFGGLTGLTDFTFTTLPSTAEPFNMIAVLAMDHHLTTSGTANGTLQYWTEGIAPNRAFVIQYLNVREFGATEISTAQCKLYETTGVIEVHVTSSTNVDRNKVVGVNNGNGTIGVLAFASGTVAAANNPIVTPFAYRFSPPSNYTTVWNPGPSGTNIFSITSAPVTTTTYTLTYTDQNTFCQNTSTIVYTPGTGVTAGTVTGGTTLCVGATTTLTAVATDGVAPYTYQWYDPTNAPRGTAATQAADMLGVWTVFINDGCSGPGVTVSATELTQENYQNCYCTPNYTTGKTSGDLISQVEITGTTLLNNSGTAPVNPAFTFFTGAPNLTANLQAGSTYNVTVTIGSFTNQGIAVWIDYNNDGIFSTPSERVGYTATNILGAFGSGSFPITLACNPPVGEHRMRVREVYATAGITINPCNTYTWGETEDYLITIDPPPPCPTPGGIAATTTGATTANVSWVPGCLETAWVLEYGPAGFTPGTGNTVPAPTNPFTLTGLSPSTPYSVLVYADCGGNGQSGPSSSTSFTTGAALSCTAGTYTDNGGAGGVYAANSNELVTICGNEPGELAAVQFSTFNTQASFDALYVYNGTTTADPLISSGNTAGSVPGGVAGGWWGTTAPTNTAYPGFLIASNPSGCLTFKFVSNATTQNAGWTATVACIANNLSCGTAAPIECGETKTGFHSATGPTNLPTGACAFNGVASTGDVNWWVYTATADQDVTVNTCGASPFDTRISIFKPITGCSDLVCVGANDDTPGCPNGTSEITFRALNGETYYVALHGTGAINGLFNLSMFCSSICATDVNDNDSCGVALPITSQLADGTEVAFTDANTCSLADGPTTCSGASPVIGNWYSFNTGENTAHDLYLYNNGTSPYTASTLSYALFSGDCEALLASGPVDCATLGEGLSNLGPLLTDADYKLLVYNNGGTARGTYGVMLTHPGLYDAEVVSITSPVGSTCDTQLYPQIVLQNNGEVTLTSVTLDVSIAGQPTHTLSYLWTGSLATGQSTVVVFPTFIETDLGGPYTMTIEAVNPNGQADVLPADNVATSVYSATGQNLTVRMTMDAGTNTSWEIYDTDFNLVASLDPVPSNTIDITTVCLSTSLSDCFYFRILDGSGDGIVGGGWELRNSAGGVVMRDDGAFTGNGSQSPADPTAYANYGESGGVAVHQVCLPVGPSAPLASECGIFNNVLKNKVYCRTVPGITNYQFEFRNPNVGTYRRITVPRSYVAFGEMVTSPLQPGVTYFVRVRVDAGNDGLANDHFGTGCEMALAAVQPACTQLISAPGATFSCGVTKTFGGSDKIWAQPVPYATQYRFSFMGGLIDIDGANPNLATDTLGVDFVNDPPVAGTRNVVRPNYICPLNWTTYQLVSGQTYQVKVQAFVSGAWVDYCGAICSVTISNPGMNGDNGRIQELVPELSSELFPNPVGDGRVNLQLAGLSDSEHTILVEMFDVFGKRVMAQEFATGGETFRTVLELDGTMATGIYMVNITVDGVTTTKRLSVL